MNSNNQNEYGVRIFEVCNNAARSSYKNSEKIKNCGLIPYNKNLISAEHNIWCKLLPARKDITKIFYQNDKEISEAKAQKLLGYAGNVQPKPIKQSNAPRQYRAIFENAYGDQQELEFFSEYRAGSRANYEDFLSELKSKYGWQAANNVNSDKVNIYKI